MQELILFLMSFVLVFIIYQIFIIIPVKRSHTSKKKNVVKKDPLEVKYLSAMYGLNLKKVNYNQLLQICAIVSSLDISICVSLIGLVNGLLTELFVGFISIVALIYVSYYFVYLFYKKKGMIKNGKHK